WFHHFKARVLKKLGWKVAWVTSGAPVELLLPFGIIPLYPENHAAVCAARKMGGKLKEASVRTGVNPDLCSYGHIDIGSVETGLSPVGGLAKPDILFCCNNICGTVLKWYQALGKYFDAPLVFIDTPFLNDEIAPGQPPPDHTITYVHEQFDDAIRELEKITGRRFNEKEFLSVTENSKATMALWQEILDCCREKPSPMTCFDAFVHMMPIVSLRGTQTALRYYRALLAEMKKRQRDGVSAIPNEKKRVVWDNIPIWPKMGALARYLKSKGVCLVADTYTTAWADNVIPDNATFRDMAQLYTAIFLNRGLRSKAAKLAGLVRHYDADAFIMHSNRSCKTYSFGQYDILKIVTEETGRPGLIIEADHADPGGFNDSQVFSRLDAFFDSIG
ncbi:MAG: 2-hydroxyacyl-CoA dehydratase family protein, partial [Pseudomonadota bacterium]